MTRTNIGTQTYRCYSFSDFCDLFPELKDTSFWQEFLDWMDVSSGDAAHTLVKMEDFRYSMESFMTDMIEPNCDEYVVPWGLDVMYFLDSPSAPLPTLKLFHPDLYIDLET